MQEYYFWEFYIRMIKILTNIMNTIRVQFVYQRNNSIIADTSNFDNKSPIRLVSSCFECRNVHRYNLKLSS